MKYIPILKNKQGEIKALKNTSSFANKITPLIELRERPDVEKLETEWQNKYFAQLADESSCVPAFFVTSKLLIPVITTNLINSALWSQFLTGIKVGNADQFLFRLNIRDIEIDSVGNMLVSSLLDQAIKEMSIDKTKLIVLIDLGEINLANFNFLKLTANLLIPKIEQMGFKKIALSSSSMINMTNIIVPAGKLFHQETIRRLDKDLFDQIQASHRDLIYSDYTSLGVFDSKFNEDQVKFMRGASKIRYTQDNGFYLVIKGKAFVKGGSKQYPILCQELIKNGHFLGKNFSVADQFIENCAKNESDGCGNLTSWITNDVTHHITLINNEI